MVAPEELSDSVIVCPAWVWLYEPGTGQKTGVAAAGGGGGGGGGAVVDPPPPQLVVARASAETKK
jgi:hypothetical protein